MKPPVTNSLAFKKAAPKKRKATKTEKIITVCGISLIAVILLGSLIYTLCLFFQSNIGQESIEGYWYTDTENVCWQFEDGLARVYVKAETGYYPSSNSTYRLDPAAGKVVLRQGVGSEVTFTYTLKGNSLTLTYGDSVFKLHRGKSFN